MFRSQLRQLWPISVRAQSTGCRLDSSIRIFLEEEAAMTIFKIGFLIFPDLTQLDFTGPLQVLARLPQSTTHIIAKSEAPVPSDCGLSLVPTRTSANCPPLDLICIPGGVNGVVDAI